MFSLFLFVGEDFLFIRIVIEPKVLKYKEIQMYTSANLVFWLNQKDGKVELN